MKKVIFAMIFCFLFAFFSLEQANASVYASTKPTPFARIVTSSAFFYSAPNSLQSSKMFLLPETYFVMLLAPEVDGFFLARYIECEGYVAKQDIKFVEQAPLTPFYESASFRVFAQNGLSLRSTPKESEGLSNKVGTLNYLENNVQLYGTIEGEEAVPFRGKTWLYCKYKPSEAEALFGYVYAGFCDMITAFTKNVEAAVYIDKPNFPTKPPPEETSGELLGKLSLKQQVILLSLLSIPAAFIIWLLFKPSQIAVGKSKKITKIRNRLDYFELD